MEKRREFLRKNRSSVITFAILNAGAILVLALFPLYCKYMWEGDGEKISVCLTVRYLKLYCPACGCTRALWSLMHLDIPSAFVYSPFLTVAAAVFIYCDSRAAVSLVRGRGGLCYLRPWMSVLLLIVLIVSFVMRNILLVFAGYDPLGDLGEFWARLRR